MIPDTPFNAQTKFIITLERLGLKFEVHSMSLEYRIDFVEKWEVKDVR